MRKLLLALVFAPSLVLADEPRVTPPPEELMRGETFEPEVTIIRRDWAVIEEYSIDGTIYAVKVQPTVGRPYYFYDTDGDGQLETRIEALDGVPEINQWQILSW